MKRSDLKARFTAWLCGEETGALDRELENALTQPSERKQREIDPEQFAKQEQAVEEKRHALQQEEEKNYLRMHEWGSTKGKNIIKAAYRVIAVIVLVAVVASLLRMVVELPPFGAADNLYNNEVGQRYIEQGIEETGAINFVAGMILDQRWT